MKIEDSGNRTHFATGAVRDMHDGKGRYDLLPWEAIHEVAKHTEAGALKYGERNVEKGIPVHSFIDSAFRHLSCYMCGKDDEKHLCAAAWNILFAIQTEIKRPEMQDIPAREGKGINEAPTIDTVRHGRYIEAKVGGMGIYPDGQVMCSECETIMPSTWRVYPPYCFGCGAKMEDQYDDGD